MVRTRQNVVTLSPEAYSLAREMATKQGRTVDNFVSEMVLDYDIAGMLQSCKTDLSQVSGLLSAILEDARQLSGAFGKGESRRSP